MRGRKNPLLDLTPVPEGTPFTFDGMARAYLEAYILQRYRTLNTARPRVEHVRSLCGGWPGERITADAVRRYQLYRRTQGAEAATINRETSALSRMCQLAIRRGGWTACRCFRIASKRIRRATGSLNTTSTSRCARRRPRRIRTSSIVRTTPGGGAKRTWA